MNIGPMEMPKAGKYLLSTVPFVNIYSQLLPSLLRTKEKKFSTKGRISHINYKSLKWITEQGCELELPVLST